jgi:Flp pilus assembly protein TadG
MHHRVNFVTFLACGLNRLRRDRSGASAIDFAIMAPVFMIGMFGILEIAMMFFGAQVLETATQDTARLIMTGQVKSTTVTKDAFKGMVCDKVKLLLNCNNLYVDAQAYSSMSEPTFDSPIENGKFVNNTKFITGKQGDIVVVRTFYAWPVYLTGLLGYDQSNLEGGKRLLSGSTAIRNEPWVN